MAISRKAALQIMEKYPDRVPIKVVTNDRMDLQRTKFLVPLNLTLGTNTSTISRIWEDQQSDYYLLAIIAKENTFG